MSGFGILVGFVFIVYSNSPVFGVPLVQVSPTCGPADPGFNIVINANGFEPMSNVAWKLVNSHNGIPLSAYYDTNATGGFNEVTYIDDVKPDSYRIYFGTDADRDSKFDVGAPTTYANITVPCR